MQAQADGTLAQLKARADGFDAIIQAAGSAEFAANLMVTEQLPKLVEEQVKAVSNLKIDKVTVWDNGNGGGNGKTSTANFLSGLAGSIPPIHEIARSAGVELPAYLGTATTPAEGEEPEAAAPKAPEKTDQAPAPPQAPPADGEDMA